MAVYINPSTGALSTTPKAGYVNLDTYNPSAPKTTTTTPAPTTTTAPKTTTPAPAPAPAPTYSSGGSSSSSSSSSKTTTSTSTPTTSTTTKPYVVTSTGQTISPTDPNYQTYVNQGAKPVSATSSVATNPNSTMNQVINNPSPATTTTTATTPAPVQTIPLVEQQANKLGNNSLANANYVNAAFQQYHGRDATQAELDRFVGNGVLDVYNAIKVGAQPIQTTPDATISNQGKVASNLSITTEKMVDNGKYNLPMVEDMYKGEEMVAGAKETIKTLEDYIQENTPKETETRREYDSLKSEISALLGQSANKANDQASEEAKRGIDALRAEYSKLNSQIRTRAAEYDALKISIEGRPITMSSIIGAQAQAEKAKIAELGLLQARALGLQGEIDTAQEAANRAVDLKYSTIETRLKIYEAQLNMIADDLNEEETIYFNARQEMLADQKEKVAEQKAIEKNIQAMALQAMQNGADGGLVDAMQKATNEVEAAKIAGALLSSEGWKYVATPAERDRLKALGYEITQSGGRTYAKLKTEDEANPEVQAYVNQIQNGRLKLINVPADIRGKVSIALGDTGVTAQASRATGGGGKSSTTQSKSSWTKEKAENLLSQYVGAGYSLEEASARVKDLTGKDVSGGIEKVAAKEMEAQLKTVVGADTFISPDDYTKARNAWIQAGLNPTTFDTKFKGYRNPNNPNYVTNKNTSSSISSGRSL